MGHRGDPSGGAKGGLLGAGAEDGIFGRLLGLLLLRRAMGFGF